MTRLRRELTQLRNLTLEIAGMLRDLWRYRNTPTRKHPPPPQ